MTDFGPRPEWGWLPVSMLSVDERYQRSIETLAGQRLIARIVKDFWWPKFHAILATPADPGWRVVDGWHRVDAARRLGIDEIPAVIIQTTSLQDQAAVFLSANRDRVKVNEFSLHHAQRAAGDPLAAAVDELCAAAGITVPRWPVPATAMKPGQTLALGQLRGLAKVQDQSLAREVVVTVADAFRGEAGALRASIFKAVWMLREGNKLSPRWAMALAQSSAAELLSNAQGYRARHGVREVAAVVEVLRRRATTPRPVFASPELKRMAMAGR